MIAPWYFLLVAATQSPAIAAPDSGWWFTDRTFTRGRPSSEEYSQGVMRPYALCVGFGDVGLRERVISIDSPKAAQPLRFVIAAPADTIQVKALAFCPQFREVDEEKDRTYLAVVRKGGEVPDSLRVVLADESSFWIRYKVKKP
jgi:hypothetical protein